mgnify:FL=1
MLYKLRTGDVILCENQRLNQTNAYLIVYDTENKFGLWCIGCGEVIGFYGNDTERMKTDIFSMNIKSIVPKETITEYLNQQCNLALPVRVHDGFHELNIIVELGE